jgi:hypothetical protein
MLIDIEHPPMAIAHGRSTSRTVSGNPMCRFMVMPPLERLVAMPQWAAALTVIGSIDHAIKRRRRTMPQK